MLKVFINLWFYFSINNKKNNNDHFFTSSILKYDNIICGILKNSKNLL